LLDEGNSTAFPTPRQSAREASLTYVSDEQPGIRRKRHSGRFSYLTPGGKTLRDAAAMERIRGLAIPPAWSDVWISPDADGHLQATGRDQRGRKQYLYHPQWYACRDEMKFSSLVEFAEALPLLRRRIDADLRRRKLSIERVLASVIWLLDNTMIRVGNAAYARDNRSFGLTTLRDRHVEIRGSTLRFAFKGKAGKEWRLKLTDRRIAKVVRGAQDLPGQQLFQYLDDQGERHGISSHDVNSYIQETTGAEFTSKHFRTWAGTVRAFVLLADEEPPASKAAARRILNRVVDTVAGHLGNTRSVCRKCYIHPGVIDHWERGVLDADIRSLRPGRLRANGQLDGTELIVLRWLRKFG
jgi:DNA topoisomerase-1